MPGEGRRDRSRARRVRPRRRTRSLQCPGTLWPCADLSKQEPARLRDRRFQRCKRAHPQKVEPLLGRATSYLALGKAKEAAADLDEASEADPQNAQVWTIRGQAYERLGDKAKAAASYTKAVALRPRDDAARSGLARVGG
ncbi:tetratricopeptide repeat protein [Bradyrhizobium guangxiense]